MWLQVDCNAAAVQQDGQGRDRLCCPASHHALRSWRSREFPEGFHAPGQTAHYQWADAQGTHASSGKKKKTQDDLLMLIGGSSVGAGCTAMGGSKIRHFGYSTLPLHPLLQTTLSLTLVKICADFSYVASGLFNPKMIFSSIKLSIWKVCVNPWSQTPCPPYQYHLVLGSIHCSEEQKKCWGYKNKMASFLVWI